MHKLAGAAWSLIILKKEDAVAQGEGQPEEKLSWLTYFLYLLGLLTYFRHFFLLWK